MKTIVHFKCNIEMDLEFYVRVRTCEKRVTEKQPLDLCSNDESHLQIFNNADNLHNFYVQV